MVELPGVDPRWSAYLDVPSTAGVDPAGTVNRWHHLDNLPSLEGVQHGTLLCVHGNPTWSYLWRSVLAAGARQGWRVVAVDQLEMGYSERTGRPRKLADRVQDLENFTAALSLSGPLVTLGHDWGGVVSLGYASRNRENLQAAILTNTAISQDPNLPIPAPLRLALNGAVHRAGTAGTTAFLDTTLALARPRLAPDVRTAYRAPYLRASRRQGIAQFVADIPVDASHPSFATLTGIAEDIRSLDVPVLMLWGPGDPIFSDTYLEDLTRRLPHADVHRFEGASHLVAEDRDIATPIFNWLGRKNDDDASRVSSDTFTPLWQQVQERAGTESLAVADMDEDGSVARSLSWRELDARITALAGALQGIGVRPGSRISLMVPPGVELTVLIYACLRLGAVIVVADAGLGAKGLSRAVRGAVPEFLVGIDRALVAARLFGWPGTRISVGALSTVRSRALGVQHSLEELASADAVFNDPRIEPDADAAILFTSGSTGPAKGVVYTHRQLSAMRDTLANTLDLRPGSALVAGFAPFALLGPALGASSVTPAMDVTAPRTLSARALADAVSAIDATVVFASPAALRNVLETADSITPRGAEALGAVKTLLSAGAPVPTTLLEALQPLVPKATLHTPYGMTEALPVTDIDLEGILAATNSSVAGSGNGVCVGTPVPGAEVAISPLDGTGSASGKPTTTAGITGEILVRAAHVKDRYHRLWITERESSRTSGWHRTGDVGHLDADGRLWVEGRLAHIIPTAAGAVTPVGAEQAIECTEGVGQAAVVGVGPAGTQAVVAVVVPASTTRAGSLATESLSAAVRQAGHSTGVEIAAVLTLPELPTDVRHNAKIDRTKVAAWAGQVLEGRRKRRP
ncbi:acyl-coenzyme A synthetase/AMP-(fatty) acid ligase/pimeloyl-ACP methyl ester carboxylesterase [Arthrobacter pigmenti]|uniref:Acyl-coenzyme A synthetase/AMP-(Fatty) acid ligase/pimeloyl-ACP methyl ester carboxylesterase n=1 Tax=Arthrobacter pigmenti TaxID=271432 RepID=A0A846RSA5_9MICC|nr:acyl-coenzyme A synthetase/AMP-(fatty) acid ligase/pimeloyl-ACP methyl ester carboxylesterase [Arthrobacter pigmenti]